MFGRQLSTRTPKGALTKFSDKCLAISGIAEKAQSLCRGTYIAGLWREDFEAQLLWTINDNLYENDDPEVRLTAPYKRPTTYVAPSWSWLSVDGAVLFSMRTRNILLDIIDIKLELSDNNSSGMIKGGWIKARGWLSAATWKATKRAEEYVSAGPSRALTSVRGHHCHAESWVTMDAWVETEEVICLPVWSSTLDHEEDGTIIGLVLAKTEARPDEYRRIGHFHIYERSSWKEDLRPFFRQRLKNGDWIDRPKTTFTIV